MKLFLNGGGCGDALKEVYKKWTHELDARKAVLYIPLAMESDKYSACLKWITEELKEFNLKIYMTTSPSNLSSLNLSDYSGIFIGGGNTFKLLKDLKENNMLDKLKSFLVNGGPIFGGSAGAIIFGKDISTCVLTDDNTKVGLTDTSGMNCINNISLLCHYNVNSAESQKNQEYLKKAFLDSDVFYLSETNTIILDEKSIEIVGRGELCIISRGSIININKGI